VARLFPTWADTAFRVALISLVLGGGGLLAAPFVYVRTPFNQNRDFEVAQPVQFDHRHHVKDDHIACLYCHSGAEKSAYAGIPATELCMGCHSQVWIKSSMLEPIRRSFFSGQPIAWNRVHKVPDFVYFNHSVHVKNGVECASCHGHVEDMATVRQVAPLTMEWCLGCHRSVVKKRSLTHCTACHR
jgi:cytochrome c7-like protein